MTETTGIRCRHCGTGLHWAGFRYLDSDDKPWCPTSRRPARRHHPERLAYSAVLDLTYGKEG